MMFKKTSAKEPPLIYAAPPKGYWPLQPGSVGQEWGEIYQQLRGRNALFEIAHKQLDPYVLDNTVRFRLAATDAFVEKAQFRLGVRSRVLTATGVMTSGLALILLLAAALTVYLGEVPDVSNGYELTVFILKSLTVGGFVGGSAYFLVALSKALFHEATVLVTRRHSLRFGRLAVYLHDGQLDNEDLMKAFRWSDEVGSAFLDLRPENVKGGAIKLVEQIPPIVEAAAKLATAARGAGQAPKAEKDQT
jgi:hypothetical protein